ncbi:DNA binding domain protein, excisionase family [Thermaerobacter marianensis DSM 12885]|uniref:DNA binding domain protein, excisionase family n=1 Tax=Thermaerobacter marianensis (strain ATCC 700841 / DSM 12885 / JCM 10246 / 7p75a) TaxID=644966 RepID=E6SHV9_THEM7|nr:helix-turn-helix domain-containing protein [Thermaerobacter marianensis]ADU51839.1 DNA binding domain protein, excisionase family [Thermaerobacter marianensis DSM 12885]
MNVKVPEVMTVSEAAAYLRVDERTVRRLLREGRLPGRKVGRQWRLHKVALDRFLDGEEEAQVWRPAGVGHDDEPTADEIKESRRAWLDYLAGGDPGRTLDELRRVLEAHRE